MMVFVTGGARSGKSTYAESVAVSLGTARVYLATLADTGEESASRIDHHRNMRAGKGFATVERARDLASCDFAAQVEPAGALPEGKADVVLLEDLVNLIANEMFSEDGNVASAEQVRKSVLDGVARLSEQSEHVVIVANELGCDGVDYASLTRDYVRLVGSLSCELAARSEHVVEVVAGCPRALKGELL